MVAFRMVLGARGALLLAALCVVDAKRWTAQAGLWCSGKSAIEGGLVEEHRPQGTFLQLLTSTGQGNMSPHAAGGGHADRVGSDRCGCAAVGG
jgi:hypothetical protein